MAELPTKEDIEKLYRKNGYDEVTWYALRNALRVLPLLGKYSMHDIWGGKVRQSIYHICRVLNILYLSIAIESHPKKISLYDYQRKLKYYRNIVKNNEVRQILQVIIHASETNALGAKEDKRIRNSFINKKTLEVKAGVYLIAALWLNPILGMALLIIAFINYGLFVAIAVLIIYLPFGLLALFFGVAVSIDTSNAGFGDFIIRDNYRNMVHKFLEHSASSGFVSSVFFKGGIITKDYLAAYRSAINGGDIYQKSLWEGENLELIDEYKNNFIKEVSELGCQFLVDDLLVMWDGLEPKDHARNYFKNWSDTIINDPKQLRRAILFGDSSEQVSAVRVLLLGSGGAGKSSLADRLQGKPIDEIKLPTVGVDYLQHQPLNLKKIFSDLEIEDTELDLFLWDFGGQTIFHGLHSAFLHENCVYLLVVDSRHEQAPDEWLHQIRHLAGSQVKVLLVTNWYEQCETYQNKTRLLREFPDLLTADSFFYFSCLDKDAPDFKRFVQSLVKASLDSQKMVLKETLGVQRALDAQYKDGDTVFVRESKLRELIAANIQDAENTDSTLNQLQQLGFLVQVEKGNSRYCLKPAWAVDNAYQLLYSPALRQANGILSLTALEHVFAGKVDEDHVEYLVNFLNERSLCIRLQDNGKYFFPDATRADEPLSVSELLNQQNKLTLRFDVPYLPLGFHARLVHKLFVPHSEVGIHDPQDIWRQGFILRAGTTSQAVVHYLLRKNVIEMVLTGDLKAFSALLREFYTHLKAVLVSPNGIRPEQIHPSVLFNQQSFSVHSGEGLVKVLAQINSYDQLFQEVRKMASTGNISVTNGQVIIGDHNTQKSHSDNTTITVTADQRKIISAVLDEMLEHKLPKDVTKAVVKMQDVVEADAEKPTEKTQSLLSRFIGGVKQIAGFTDDANKIGEFVANHYGEIGTAITAIGSIAS